MSKIKKYFKYLLIGVIIFSAIFTTFSPISADEGSDEDTPVTFYSKGSMFSERDYAFVGLSDDVPDKDSYPYNSSPESVSLDLAYGTHKRLLTYYGEIPKELATKNACVAYPYQKNANIDWESRGIVVEDTNNTSDSAISDCIELATVGNVNKSLRLYALTFNTNGSMIGSFIASAFNGLSLLISQGLKIVVYVKNFDVSTIIGLFGGGSVTEGSNKISKFLYNTFIYTEEGKIAPYLIFCMVGCLFSIAGAAWAYFKQGSGSLQKFKETVIFVLIGFMIIGMSAAGNASTIGKKLSDIGSIAATATAASGNESLDYFSNSTNAPSKDTMHNEIALINKMYIDNTLIQNLGSKFFENSTKDEVNYAYYFWASNSAAKVDKNKLTTNTTAANSTTTPESNMNNFINDLDNSSIWGPKNITARSAVATMASPEWGNAITNNILLIIVMVLLTMSMISIAGQCLKGNMELLIGSFGFAVAGPLFLVNNKTRQIAKSILFLFVIGFIRLTIYSIIFDICLVTIAAVLGSYTIINFLVAIAFCLLFRRAVPAIDSMINRRMDTAMHRYAPTLANMEHAIEGKTGAAFGKAQERLRFGGDKDNLLSASVGKLGQAFGNKTKIDMYNPIKTGVKNVTDAVSDRISHYNDLITQARKNKISEANLSALEKWLALKGDVDKQAAELNIKKYHKVDENGKPITDKEEYVDNLDRKLIMKHNNMATDDYDKAREAVDNYNKKVKAYKDAKEAFNDPNILHTEAEKAKVEELKEEMERAKQTKDIAQSSLKEKLLNDTSETLMETGEFKRRKTDIVEEFKLNEEKAKMNGLDKLQEHVDNIENIPELAKIRKEAYGTAEFSEDILKTLEGAKSLKNQKELTGLDIDEESAKKELASNNIKVVNVPINQSTNTDSNTITTPEQSKVTKPLTQETQPAIKTVNKEYDQVQLDLFGAGTAEAEARMAKEELQKKVIDNLSSNTIQAISKYDESDNMSKISNDIYNNYNRELEKIQQSYESKNAEAQSMITSLQNKIDSINSQMNSGLSDGDKTHLTQERIKFENEVKKLSDEQTKLLDELHNKHRSLKDAVVLAEDAAAEAKGQTAKHVFDEDKAAKLLNRNESNGKQQKQSAVEIESLFESSLFDDIDDTPSDTSAIKASNIGLNKESYDDILSKTKNIK